MADISASAAMACAASISPRRTLLSKALRHSIRIRSGAARSCSSRMLVAAALSASDTNHLSAILASTTRFIVASDHSIQVIRSFPSHGSNFIHRTSLGLGQLALLEPFELAHRPLPGLLPVVVGIRLGKKR